jgi:threonine-phosphate decarboxylase
MLIRGKYVHGGGKDSAVKLDYSVNVNLLGTPGNVVRAIQDAALCCGEYPDAYCAGLRSGLSRLYGVDADSIICGNGATELIDSFVAAIGMVHGGGKVLVALPAFAEYEVSVKRHGLEYAAYATHEQDGFAIGEGLLGEVDGRTAGVLVCSPSNPVGNELDRGILERLLGLCDGLGIHCLLDVSFLDLTQAPDWGYMLGLVGRHKSLFLLSSFTKSHALAGVRLGFAFCGDAGFMEAVSRQSCCWNVSALAQAAGLEVVQMELASGTYLTDARKIIADERRYLTGVLEGLGFKVYPGAANYMLFSGARHLGEALLGMGVRIRDCCGYDGLSQGFYRICIKKHIDNEVLAECLGAAVKEIAHDDFQSPIPGVKGCPQNGACHG